MLRRPIQIVFIILLLNALLIAYSYVFSVSNNNFIKEHLKFITTEDLVNFKANDENLVADSLLSNYLSGSSSADALFHRIPLNSVGPKKQNVFLTNPQVANGKSLDNFFYFLSQQKDTAVVRVAHYGDSQLEGDRMTSVIRQKMHKKFGGSGIGYVPLKDLAPISYGYNPSGNWKRYTVFHDKYNSAYYGLSGTVCRFSKMMVEEPVESAEDTTASGNIDTNKKPKTFYYQNGTVSVRMGAQHAFQQISVLYANATESCVMKVYDNSSQQLIYNDTLPFTQKVTIHKTKIPACLNVKVEFSADQSPDFYGLYFDSKTGVQVDNYAIRGHSGDGLLLIDDAHLANMLRYTNTRLIVFQYGANVVPYINSEKVCNAIGEVYYKLFMKFKKAAPDISILVVGAGDMARGGEGGYASYKWLPKINEMQKNAALKAGCAYWDLFNMMGGANSVLVWADKNLAVTNGHFSGKGQELVANEIVEALMIEYNDYLFRKRNTTKK